MNNDTTVLTAAQVKVLADYPSVAEEYFTKPDTVTEGDAIELANWPKERHVGFAAVKMK